MDLKALLFYLKKILKYFKTCKILMQWNLLELNIHRQESEMCPAYAKHFFPVSKSKFNINEA